MFVKLPCNVAFHFSYDKPSAFTRSFVLKFQVEVNQHLNLINQGEDETFEDALQDCLQSMDTATTDVNVSGWSELFGWSTYSQERYGDPLIEVQRLKEFFLAEGFEGGEIVEMGAAQYDAYAHTDRTQTKLLQQLRKFDSTPSDPET
jgi:hypothetical protein